MHGKGLARQKYAEAHLSLTVLRMYLSQEPQLIEEVTHWRHLTSKRRRMLKKMEAK